MGLYEEAARQAGKRGTRRQAEEHADDAAHAFADKLRQQWDDIHPHIESQFYYGQNTDQPNRIISADLQNPGNSRFIKFECSIGYFAGTYEGYWRIYEPYGRFGQDDNDEFEALGFAGHISGSKKKVIEGLSWAYSKIRSQGKTITRMAQQLG
jgi:hypothetical protein